MEHLFLVRHGHYDVTAGNLEIIGRKESESLAEKIHEIIGQNKSSLHLATSPKIRATETAEIIAKKLGITNIDKVEALHAPGGSVLIDQRNEVDKLIKSHEEDDVIILVTHLPFVDGAYPDCYPEHFVKMRYGKELKLKQTARNGQAFHFNMETGMYEIIP